MQALTEDLEAVKAAIDTIDSSGGTNIGEGLRVALDELDRLGTPDRGRVVVLLTDGDGFYDHALTDRAAASGTVVYTVGLGSGVRPALLESIDCTMTPTRTSTTSTPRHLDKGQAFIGGALVGESGRSWVARNVARLTAEHLESPWYLAAWLAGGYVAIGDVRDAAYFLVKGSFGDAALSAIGLLPFVGDALKTARVAVEYVELVPKGALPAVRWMSRNLPLGPFRKVVDDIIAAHGPVRLELDIDRQALDRTSRANTTSRIGTDTVQAQALKDDLDRIRLEGATDILVNQEQVDAGLTRVGRNRPDLQYTHADGNRVSVKYDRPLCSDLGRSSRGAAHEQRIKANDPTAVVILKVLGERCE